MFVILIKDTYLLIPLGSKGKAAKFILKGASKKRTREEFQSVHEEQEEL
jgi:hypothetical protein